MAGGAQERDAGGDAGLPTTDATSRVGAGRRVLLVSNVLSGPKGSHTYSVDLSRRLRELGWHVIATSARPSRFGRTADMLWTTWRQSRRVSLAIVDVFSGAAFRWAEAVTRILRRRQRPILLVLHGGGLPALRSDDPSRVARLLRRAAVVVAPSAYLARQLGDLGVPIEVLPNAVETARYPWRARDPLRPEIAWLRAIHPVYAPELAVQAFASLHATHPNARLRMAGPVKDAETLARLHAAIEREGLGPFVRLEGAIPNTEVPAWLDQSDIFLNTSVVDNTPVTLLEAMASGLCLVSSDAGGIVDLIGAADSALLAPSGNAEALADALRSVLDEPAPARARAERARRQVEAMDWRHIVPRWDRLLWRCLEP